MKQVKVNVISTKDTRVKVNETSNKLHFGNKQKIITWNWNICNKGLYVSISFTLLYSFSICLNICDKWKNRYTTLVMLTLVYEILTIRNFMFKVRLCYNDLSCIPRRKVFRVGTKFHKWHVAIHWIPESTYSLLQ